MNGVFSILDVGIIISSVTNRRKKFTPLKMAELAEDIKSRGVDTPITVRPLPGSRLADTDRKVQYELVCGERRWRASKMAGVPTIPAMVRALTDEQALEIQICENLQSEDLTELEEAEGYEDLMKLAEITAEEVGKRIGKSKSYVYARLKLLDLCSEARASLRDGKIDASRSLLVARIPDQKLQIKAMAEIIEGTGYSNPKEPMTYRQAQLHLQQNYMLKLSDAKFKITSVDLVPEAGSCKTCNKRTGHDPDLFSEIKGADVCIDPPCFHKKEEAHKAELVKKASEKGQTVITGKEAQELKANNSYNGKILGYRRLDKAEDSPTEKPLRNIIGDLMKAEGIKPVLIEDPRDNGEFMECLPNEVVLKLLTAVEKTATATAEQTANAPKISKHVQQLVDEKKAKAKAKAKAAYEQDWRDSLVARTWETIARSDDVVYSFNMALHRFIALQAAKNLSTEQAAKVGNFLGLDKIGTHSALIDYIKTSDTPDAVHMLIIMIVGSNANDLSYADRVANEGMHLIAGIVHSPRLDTTLQDIQAEALAKHFPQVKERKAALAPAPAARAKEGGGGNKGAKSGGDAAASKKSPVRAAKLSAEEATQGIADALQGIEGAASASAVALPAEPAGGANAVSVAPPAEDDALLAAAEALVAREQKASVRLLKSELKVGTTKAMELMSWLEKLGKVSACDERGGRKVLVQP